MKRLTYLTAIVFAAIIVTVWDVMVNVNRKVYMPDMAYSRAVESYSMLDSAILLMTLQKQDIKYFITAPGKWYCAIGELPFYSLPNDSTGYK